MIVHHSINGKPKYLEAERSFKLVRCFQCHRVGHIGRACIYESRCGNCSATDIQITSVVTRVNAHIATGITTPLQPSVQYIRIYFNITELSCFFKHSHFKMKILSFNCQLWNTTKDCVNSLVMNYNLDIIYLLETWEKENKPLQFGSWPILSKPRSKNSGHGVVAILCKSSDDILIARQNNLGKPDIEAIFAEVMFKDNLNLFLPVA